MPMNNKYGTIARDYWMKHLPRRFSTIGNPDSYFSDLGDQIEERVDELRDAIAGEDSTMEMYLDKLGRLNEATRSAEAQALQEMLPEPEATENPPN
jgi:hypothetical protein